MTRLRFQVVYCAENIKRTKLLLDDAEEYIS